MKFKTTVLCLLAAIASMKLAAQSNPIRLTSAETVSGIVNPGPFGASPEVVVSGDFNNDGNLDLLTIASGGRPNSVILLEGQGDGTFAPPVSVISGGFNGYPVTMLAGDFNKDGNLDFAFLLSNGSTFVYVYLGNGQGGFTANGSYAVGDLGNCQTCVHGLATADLRHIGRLDLVAVSTIPNTSEGAVYVLLNKGDGTFRPPVVYAANGVTSTSPYDVAIGDVNGDSKLDLVMSNQGPGGQYLSVLLGNGDGTFQAPLLDPANGAYSYSNTVALGDLNGDQKLDAVIATAQGATVLLGNGDGTFQAPVNVMAPSGAYTYADVVSLPDVNKDGKLDLVLSFQASEGGGTSDAATVMVFLGNGDGTFQPGRGFATQAWPSSIVLADFNKDGVLDFAAGSNGDDFGVTVALGNGDGTFQAGANYGYAQTWAQGFVSADFNGDGNLDVAFARDNGTINVFLGNSHGSLSPVAVTTSISGNYYVTGTLLSGNGALRADGMVAVDINGDGKMDLVATVDPPAGGTPTSFAVFLGNGNGTFGSATFYSTGDDSGIGSPIVADFNGDNKPDVLIPNNDGNLSLFLNQGNGSLGNPAIVGTDMNYYPLAGDFTGSGHQDVLLYGCPGSSSNALAVLPGNGDGTFGAPIPSGMGVCAIAAVAADFNNDHKLDLAVGGYQNGGAVQVLLGNGDGTFTSTYGPAQVSGTCANVGPYNLAAADLNMDGNLDLIVALAATSDGSGFAQWPCGGNLGVVVYSGNGDGTFSQNVADPPYAPFLVGPDSGGVLVADFNKDGMPDVAVLNGQAPNCCGDPNTFFTVLLNRTAAVGVSPDALTFAKQLAGTTSSVQTVVVTNNTNSAVNLSALAITGTGSADFRLSNYCPASLAAGRNCTLYVAFSPNDGGNLTAAITGAGGASVALSGLATQVGLSATKLNFGTVTVGQTSAAQSVTVTNTGNTTLDITQMKITGAEAADFFRAAGGTCGATLPASQSCAIPVRFRPQATGARSAYLQLTDNGGASPQYVALLGTGE
jgi:hypothetical protein